MFTQNTGINARKEKPLTLNKEKRSLILIINTDLDTKSSICFFFFLLSLVIFVCTKNN